MKLQILSIIIFTLITSSSGTESSTVVGIKPGGLISCYECGLGIHPESCDPLPTPLTNCTMCEYDINYDGEKTRYCNAHDGKVHDVGCIRGLHDVISCYCNTDLCNKDHVSAGYTNSSSLAPPVLVAATPTILIMLMLSYIL